MTSFWFGCNNAAKEIVKERAIYTRERDFNVRVGSYYCSKFLLLMFFSGLQAPGPGGHCQGLVRSACRFRGAVSGAREPGGGRRCPGAGDLRGGTHRGNGHHLIPMAILPQIILSGVIAPLDRAEQVPGAGR